MRLSAEEGRRISGSASTGAGACQIVIIMKTLVSNVTCHRFRGMRYATLTSLLHQEYLMSQSNNSDENYGVNVLFETVFRRICIAAFPAPLPPYLNSAYKSTIVSRVCKHCLNYLFTVGSHPGWRKSFRGSS